MTINTITEAKAMLSKLIERVQAGEQIIIGKAGKPVAILSQYQPHNVIRKPGALEGKIKIADDFDELPPNVAKAFGVESK